MPGARYTRDVDDLVAWLATKIDKAAVTRLARINWRPVGTMIERVVGDELDPRRLDDLYEIAVDEVTAASSTTGHPRAGFAGRSNSTLTSNTCNRQKHYTGASMTDRAVFRPSNGRWYVQGQASVPYGTAGDIPVPGDYTQRWLARRATARVHSSRSRD